MEGQIDIGIPLWKVSFNFLLALMSSTSVSTRCLLDVEIAGVLDLSWSQKLSLLQPRFALNEK